MPHSSESEQNIIPRILTPEVLQAMRSVRFIAQHIKDADKDNEVSEVVLIKISVKFIQSINDLKID